MISPPLGNGMPKQVRHDIIELHLTLSNQPIAQKSSVILNLFQDLAGLKRDAETSSA